MPYENEAKTRKTRIDGKLTSLGWRVIPFDEGRLLSEYNRYAITEYPTSNGPADYVLVSNGRIIAIVEAKKVSVGPQSVLNQAQRYAQGVEDSPFDFDGYRVPFIYSTNGELFYFQDLRAEKSRSRRVSGFHRPSALEEMLLKNEEDSFKWFLEHENDNERIRPYQREANDAIESSLMEGKRRMLLAMATGTGKTYTIISSIYRLMKSGYAKRILFLVDRRALAAQAVTSLNAFEPEKGLKFSQIYEIYSQRFQKEDFDEENKFDPNVMPNNYLENPQPSHAFVYVSTIQRMRVNLFGWKDAFESSDQDSDDEGDAKELKIAKHAFDVIIADECHRGYTSNEIGKWRQVLDYFDAVKIGLTATPAAHTTAYFNDVVYRYDYERAVREGFLVDWDAVKLKSKIRMNGMFLNKGEMVGKIDTETGLETLDKLEDEREFDSGEIERKITSPDSNKKIIQEIAKYAKEHEEKKGHFPKTLIFAANDLPHTSHCDNLVNICRDVFGRGDAFVKKITGSQNVDRPLQRIREFRNRQNPGIVVTRDMLTTGVDIPKLEYLVFLRPVKSRILWEQMLGRGTRRCEEINKSKFTVFDCFDGTLIDYFKNATAIEPMAPDRVVKSHTQLIDDIYQNKDRKYNVRCLVKRLQRIDKQMGGKAREEFSVYIPEGDVCKFAKELESKIENDFTDTMKIIQDPDFQKLLINYTKADRTFIVSYETTDEVSSEWVVKNPEGGYWKPEDYLVAFSKFVKENTQHIEAIEILLERPKDWSTETLLDLRLKLIRTKENFSAENLRKAYRIRHQKALADIISMVKHAADEDEPIFTAEERVSNAFNRITQTRDFTEEQIKWLERIKLHLIENLTIDREDIDTLPIFQREGGWGAANKAFDEDLDSIINEFNKEVAS